MDLNRAAVNKMLLIHIAFGGSEKGCVVNEVLFIHITFGGSEKSSLMWNVCCVLHSERYMCPSHCKYFLPFFIT